LDEARPLAIAGSGDVYVAGTTWSTNFPNTTGGAQASYGGGDSDAFVARLNATLTSNPQSTYLGGSRLDEARSLAIAGSGDVYVAGLTRSTNFPDTTGGAQASNGGYWDAFVARFSADLTSNPQSTYLGGSGDDYAYALAIAGSGDVYVAGRTFSTDFPNTAGGAQASNRGFLDAFVARLNSTLTSNLQSTYLGGSEDEEALALAIAGSGDVYVAGTTWSTNFPNTTGGAQPNYGGGGDSDAFVARLNATLTSNPQSTYLGGSRLDEARSLAIAGSGDVYVAGLTRSTNFPDTTGGAQESHGGGGSDAFVARLTANLASAGGCQVPPQLAGEVVYVPLVEVGGKEYSARLGLVSGRPLLELISVEPVSPLLPAECRDKRATLSGDRVHIPLAVYGGHSYAGELRMFEENGRLLFEVVSARPLD
jgi:hypothetical protein